MNYFPAAKGLVSRQNDAEAVDRVTQMVAQVKVFLDGAQEIGLLAIAKLLGIGLVGHFENLIWYGVATFIVQLGVV
jgi:hypothetical protein